MKRRKFIFNSIGGLVGLIGLSTSNTLINNAMALPSAGKSPIDIGNARLISETIVGNFSHKKHVIKIAKGVYQKQNGSRVNQSTMTYDGRKLPQGYFRRLGDAGCYSSELLPFNDDCDPRKLAEALSDADDMRLFELNPQEQ
jgi:hypothetical protein